MGRRKNRKRERRQEQQSTDRWMRLPQVSEEEFLTPEPVSLMGIMQRYEAGGQRAELPKTCGNCRQFVEDHDFGRGTCLHIASGILNPFTDTPACEYFERTRSAQRR
ncbi:MAG: hypothetical protein ABI577_15390 [bacterium]